MKPPRPAKTGPQAGAVLRPEQQPMMAELYRRAQARLRKQGNGRTSKTEVSRPKASPARLLHELQVHQVELELQNAELQKARDELELALEKYTDLYDFAPVGYISLDESGEILEANLTGASLLGVARSRLIHRRILQFMSPASQPVFLDFLQQAFSGTGSGGCEAQLLSRDNDTFWASFRAAPATSLPGARQSCRVAFANITASKQAKVLDVQNRELQREILRREAMEASLRQSQKRQSHLLTLARDLQEQLRCLSRRLLRAQEKERRKISRELHDVIAQTLAGISVRLAALSAEAALDPKSLARQIARTQRLVEQSVKIVQNFARELRPTMLDDLGLVPALHMLLKDFTVKTGVRTHLTVLAGEEQLDTHRRTALFRVAQEALTNVALHAKASRVRVDLQRQAGYIYLKIADNGKSFDMHKTSSDRGRKHLGLLGMRERLEMVGGRLGIQSTPGKGTIIEARIPLRRPAGGETFSTVSRIQLKSL